MMACLVVGVPLPNENPPIEKDSVDPREVIDLTVHRVSFLESQFFSISNNYIGLSVQYIVSSFLLRLKLEADEAIPAAEVAADVAAQSEIFSGHNVPLVDVSLAYSFFFSLCTWHCQMDTWKNR